MVALINAPPDGYKRTAIVWDGGWLQLDASVRENITNRADVTDHPVDSGGSITDHVRPLPIEITLDAWVTNTPLRLPDTHAGFSQQIENIQLVEIKEPLIPASVGGVSLPLGGTSSLAGFDLSHRKVVALSFVDFVPALDRVNEVYSELEAIQGEARLLTLQMGRFRSWDNMVLKQFDVVRDVNTSQALVMTMTLRQVKLVETKTILNIPGDPANARSKPNQNSGTQQATGAGDADSAQSKSFLASTLDAT